MSEDKEQEANYFAICLLMPEALVRREVESLGPLDLLNDVKVAKLARKFEVPISLMVLRLAELYKGFSFPL